MVYLLIMCGSTHVQHAKSWELSITFLTYKYVYFIINQNYVMANINVTKYCGGS